MKFFGFHAPLHLAASPHRRRRDLLCERDGFLESTSLPYSKKHRRAASLLIGAVGHRLPRQVIDGCGRGRRTAFYPSL